MTRENYEEMLKSSGKIVGMVLGEPSLDDSVGLITGQGPYNSYNQTCCVLLNLRALVWAGFQLLALCSGLRQRDIDYLTEKYKLERNDAIKRLRASNGDLISAFVDIENSL